MYSAKAIYSMLSLIEQEMVTTSVVQLKDTLNLLRSLTREIEREINYREMENVPLAKV